jgi:hypothetical protein
MIKRPWSLRPCSSKHPLITTSLLKVFDLFPRSRVWNIPGCLQFLYIMSLDHNVPESQCPLETMIQIFVTKKWSLERFDCGEPAISLHSNKVPLVQWSTHLLPVMRDPGSIPRGILMWNRDSPVSVVSLHWWPRRDWSLWPHLRRASYRTDTRPSCRLCDNPTWSHIALLSRFHAHCRSSFRLHNWHSRLLGWGEPCGGPAISLHSYTVPNSSDSPVCFLSWGPEFNPQGDTDVKPEFSC